MPENEHVFLLNFAQARRVIEAWRIDYNTERPHSRSRLFDTERVRGKLACRASEAIARDSASAGNGPGRCGIWDLRVPSVAKRPSRGELRTDSTYNKSKIGEQVMPARLSAIVRLSLPPNLGG